MRRFDCGTADWHVFARGARRLELFRDDQDFRQFLVFLAHSLKKSGCTLWAFALMTNHYHLVLRGSSLELRGCMQRLNKMYSLYHNKRYGLSGHAFDGPYHAYRQATPFLTLGIVAYVFMNPVKGGLCLLPEDYTWSCYRSFVGQPGGSFKVHSAPLMRTVHSNPKVAWRKFQEAIRREARRPAKLQAGRMTMVQVHVQQFEWLLEQAQEHADRLGGEDPKTVAMHCARQCGISPRAIARALELDGTTRVRQALHRFKERLAKNPSLARRLALP
ncbi:MAG: transposase [Planctomycetes bacterium]|nr:transposase [Planctomycetota bacterium]